MRKTMLSCAAAWLMITPDAAAPAHASQAAQPSDAGAWQIGPVIGRRNHSVGMPLSPRPGRGGWFFDFPYPSVRAGHVHYVTFNHGSLAGKRRIVMRYRIDAAPGVRFVPREKPSLPATVSLFFQRRGDTWSGRGPYETYRWWSPNNMVLDLRPGVHELSVGLSQEWISVNGRPASALPAEYQEAIRNAGRVGFVLGTREARGHGVFSTGPARLTVLSFRVI